MTSRQRGAGRAAARWQRWVLWGALLLVPSVKTAQILLTDELAFDVIRQIVLVAAGLWLVHLVIHATPQDDGHEPSRSSPRAIRAGSVTARATPGRIETWLRRQRTLIAVGAVADPVLFDDGQWWKRRWVLALAGAAVATVAAGSWVDGWIRWVLASVTAVALVVLVIVELARFRAWSRDHHRTRAAHPVPLWTAGPLVVSGTVTAYVLAGMSEPSGLDGGKLAELAVITALGEELIFRGCLLALAYRVLAPNVAHIVVAASFGLWHVGDAWNGSAGDSSGQRVAQIAGIVLVTFVAGLVLIYLRQRGRTIWAPTFAHIASNLPGIAL